MVEQFAKPATSVYDEVLATGGYIANHESDLYIEVTPENTEILRRYGVKTATIFWNQVTGKRCYDVPFAYMPFWRRKSAPEISGE